MVGFQLCVINQYTSREAIYQFLVSPWKSNQLQGEVGYNFTLWKPTYRDWWCWGNNNSFHAKTWLPFQQSQKIQGVSMPAKAHLVWISQYRLYPNRLYSPLLRPLGRSVWFQCLPSSQDMPNPFFTRVPCSSFNFILKYFNTKYMIKYKH